MAHSIIEEIGQILPPSRNLADTLGRAASYALQQGHGEVTLEHLLLALTEDPDAGLVLSMSRIEIDQLKGDVSIHLGRLESRSADACSASTISSDLRHILEAAAAAARGRRAEIDGAIVLAAIVGDGKSTAAHMLRAHGLTFEDAIRALQNALQASEAPSRPEAPRPTGQAPVVMPQPATKRAEIAPPVAQAEARPNAAPEPNAHHATSSSNADDILASARQRVQQRNAPDVAADVGGEGMDSGGEAAPSHSPQATHVAPGARARAESLQGAEAAADAEFDRIAKEIADAARPATEERPGRGHDVDGAVDGGRAGEPATANPREGGSGASGAAKVVERDAAAAPPGAPAPIGPRPAPPGRRPLPPGAIRPHAGAQPAPPPVSASLDRPHGVQSAEPAPRHMPPPGPLPMAGHETRSPERDVFGPKSLQPQSQPANAAVPATAPPPAARMPPARFPSAPSHQGLPGMPVNRSPAANAAPPRPPQSGADMQRRGEAMAPPAPMPAPGRTSAQVERKRAADVSLGQLVENIPRVMRVGLPVVVQARIARSDVKALAEGLQGGGSVWRHELTVTKAMSVRMRAPDGGFYIETSSPETQWIENSLGLITDDYASWRWTVTPNARGPRRLQLVISARTVGTDGLTAETAMPDQIIAVKVRINYAKSAKRLGGWALAAIFGGVLARFGEDLPAAVAKIVGSFIK